MDPAGALAALGQQLHDFLVSQCAPPAGVPAGLAFLPVGVAVQPETFYIDGEVNPLLVQEWLAAVADPIGEIESQTVAAQQGHATQLMALIAAAAAPTDPIGSDAANLIGALKSMISGATVPSTDVVSYAPLAWYDPAAVGQWPNWTTSTGQPGGPGGATLGPPVVRLPPNLWQWRAVDPPRVLLGPTRFPRDPDPVAVTLPGIRVDSTPVAAGPVSAASSRHSLAPRPEAGPGPDPDPETVRHRPASPAAITESPVVTTIASGSIGPARPIGIRFPEPVMINTNWLHDVTTGVGGGPGEAVSAPSLQMTLKYQIVQLSRTSWWSDALIAAKNWCFPGESAGAQLGGNLPDGTALGLTTGLVVTDGVRLSGTWTDTDRSAVTTSTHLGPWAIPPGAQIDTAGVLELPGMTAVAVLYQVLPMLPPADDPALPPPAPPPPGP